MSRWLEHPGLSSTGPRICTIVRISWAAAAAAGVVIGGCAGDARAVDSGGADAAPDTTGDDAASADGATAQPSSGDGAVTQDAAMAASDAAPEAQDGGSTDGGTPDCGTRCAYATSCADLSARNTSLPDGTYTIQPLGADGGPLEPFAVYCAAMGTSAPRDYLSLVDNFESGDGESNYVYVPGDGACQCAAYPITRYWTKVRLIVPALVIDPTDLTFSRLEQTSDAGGATFGNGRQTLDMTGGGSCGGTTLNGPLMLDRQ